MLWHDQYFFACCRRGWYLGDGACLLAYKYLLLIIKSFRADVLAGEMVAKHIDTPGCFFFVVFSAVAPGFSLL